MEKRIKQIVITYADGEEKKVDKAMISTAQNGILLTEAFGMSANDIRETLASVSFFANELMYRPSQLN